MKITIESLRLKNFKSFQDVEIKNIPSLCVLIGANGSGKSNLLDVFSFISDCLEYDVTYALLMRGGYNQVVSRGHEEQKIEIHFDLKIIYDNISQIGSYSLVIHPLTKELVSDRFDIYPFYTVNFAGGEGQGFDWAMLQDNPHNPPLICIEDPSQNQYFSLFNDLSTALKKQAQQNQLFLTTHSPQFLNEFGIESVFWLFKRNGYTRVRRVKNDPQIVANVADGAKMGDLLEEGWWGEIDTE